MFHSKVVAIAAMLAFPLGPAMAQNSHTYQQNSHTYQGGPKSDLPSHGVQHSPTFTGDTLNMDTRPVTNATSTHRSGRGHTYQGGPKTSIPHSY